MRVGVWRFGQRAARSFAAPGLGAALGLGVALTTVACEPERKSGLMVVSPTFYPNLQDTRLAVGLEACRKAKSKGISLLLVDASPLEVKCALREAGATVHPQTFQGRKGAALRECIDIASSQLDPTGVIAFQELEKVNMVELQLQVFDYMRRHRDCDVCLPSRSDATFKRSYPM